MGLALTNTVDSFMNSYGTFFTLSVEIIEQTELMMGYAYSFYLARDASFRVGIAARPFFRYYNHITSNNIFDAAALDGDVIDSYKRSFELMGIGVGVDAGTQLEWRGLFVGLVIRDIFTPIYNFSKKNTSITGDGESATYYIPFSLNAGVGYKLVPSGKVGEIFNILLYGELVDPLDNTNTDSARSSDFLTHLHVGTQVILLPPVISIQAGLNKGYPTAGMGVYIKPFYISYVIYTQEEGRKIKEQPSPGMGLEISFKW